MRVAIIGGGVSGFSCAVQILEHYKNSATPMEVTVISEAFSPNTTGDGSAGLWSPYLLGDTPKDKVHFWSKSMHKFLEELWLSEDAGEAGVCLIPVIRLTSDETPIDDSWKDIVYGFAKLTQKELQEYNVGRPRPYVSGMRFVTYTSEPVRLLPYLMKRFQKNGGNIIHQKVENLKDFIRNTTYDVIINCTGLGSREMVADTKMYPVRGQVTRVKANWIFYALLDECDDGNYIIPNCESVVLGGTHQVGDYNTKVCPNDKRFIVEGCKQIVPGLAHVEHLRDWVGLRPGRGKLHLEAEKAGNKIVIHNYGHGGSGVTLAWGCAENVLQLLQRELELRNRSKSKL